MQLNLFVLTALAGFLFYPAQVFAVRYHGHCTDSIPTCKGAQPLSYCACSYAVGTRIMDVDGTCGTNGLCYHDR
ncbi:unnamed protein product [Zymoseptoria tritici ST99CH_3D1]|uniref:Extracellular membrane protein CFEM domain-containing protein n=1 Tax=Zymoseptoria tritici (strain ST99CH_3D7) TaxID=1276538 RepID=A0A1X7RWI9_ZYMT9|nr:unnamed protein product [Zymoseptoria tritici ST99CH_3D7]SMR54892.1 unnamed protein product [Zymoseptoria tritici ST99CH_3D1]